MRQRATDQSWLPSGKGQQPAIVCGTEVSNTNRLTSIDALRGIAALSVVAYHARGDLWIGVRELWRTEGLNLCDANVVLGYLTGPLYFGFLGVPLFFVLSGYCIHRRGATLLAENAEGRLPVRRFFLRRLWRIYPTYLAALVLTALIDGYATTHLGVEPRAGQDNSPFTFTASVLSLQGLVAPMYGSNTVLWTLSIEMHLYAVYPILFCLSRRWGPTVPLIMTLAVSLGYLAADHLFDLNGCFPYRHGGGPLFLPFWFTWTIGFFIAELEAGRTRLFGWLPWVIAPGLLIGALLTLSGQRDAAEFAFALAFGGLLLCALKWNHTWWWSNRIVFAAAFVGVFSYSLYAVHRPCLVLLRGLFLPARAATLWPTIGAITWCVAFAWVFFQCVERWSLRPPAKRLLTPKPHAAPSDTCLFEPASMNGRYGERSPQIRRPPVIKRES